MPKAKPFTKEQIISKTTNTPHIDKELKGITLGIIRNGHFVENN